MRATALLQPSKSANAANANEVAFQVPPERAKSMTERGYKLLEAVERVIVFCVAPTSRGPQRLVALQLVTQQQHVRVLRRANLQREDETRMAVHCRY